MLLNVTGVQAAMLVDGLLALPASVERNALLEKLEQEIENELKRNQQEAKGELTKEQCDLLVSTLIDYVLTKQPSDLSSGHDGNWFDDNGRWNWRNPFYPLDLIAKQIGCYDEVCNTQNCDLNKLLNRVKRNADVVRLKLQLKRLAAFRDSF